MEENCHTQTEIWKDIPGWEGMYQGSNLGRIKSLKTLKERILKERVINGYLNVVLYKDGKGSIQLVHRLVALAFLKNPDNKPCVDHINGVRNDCRVENLRWCSQKENCNFELALENRSKAMKIAQSRLEVNAKRSASLKITYAKPEVRKKLSESIKVACARPDVKAKRSKAQINNPKKSKIVQQYTKEGVLVAEYPSIREAERQTGLGRKEISNCCKGKKNYNTCGGFSWRYKEEAA